MESNVEWEVPILLHLREKHPFPFDDKVVFEPVSHTYGIRTEDGILEGIRNVSSLIPKDLPDMSRVAEFVARSFKRNFDAYVKRVRSQPLRKRTYRERHREMDGTLDKLTVDIVEQEVYDRVETDPTYVPDIKVTGEDVLLKWDEWCEHGKALHDYIDHRLNESKTDIKLAQPELEIKQVDDFLCDFRARGGVWIRTELRIGSLDDKVCGSPDALAKIDGKYVIYDWKRSRNVRNPETGVDGRALREYQFQLTAYKKLLEVNGVETSDTGYLVVFHPIYDTYQEIPVDLLELRAQVDEAFKNGTPQSV